MNPRTLLMNERKTESYRSMETLMLKPDLYTTVLLNYLLFRCHFDLRKSKKIPAHILKHYGSNLATFIYVETYLPV